MKTVRILIKKELQNLRLENSETYTSGYKIFIKHQRRNTLKKRNKNLCSYKFT